MLKNNQRTIDFQNTRAKNDFLRQNATNLLFNFQNTELMSSKIAVVLEKRRKKANGKFPVKIRFNFKCQAHYINTGIEVPEAPAIEEPKQEPPVEEKPAPPVEGKPETNIEFIERMNERAKKAITEGGKDPNEIIPLYVRTVKKKFPEFDDEQWERTFKSVYESRGLESLFSLFTNLPRLLQSLSTR